MKERNSPHSIRSAGFPYVHRLVKPAILHLYHIPVSPHIPIASCTPDYNVIKVAIVLILHKVLAHRLEQLEIHRHRLLIQSSIQCLLDEICLDIHQACNPIALTFGRACSRSAMFKQALTLLSLTRSLHGQCCRD